MKDALKEIKAGLLNLQLQDGNYQIIYDYLNSSPLLNRLEADSKPVNVYGYFNSQLDEENDFSEYAEKNEEFLIRISKMDIRTIFLIDKSYCKGVSLEEITSKTDPIPVYKLVAAK